jgi:cytochrome c553
LRVERRIRLVRGGRLIDPYFKISSKIRGMKNAYRCLVLAALMAAAGPAAWAAGDAVAGKSKIAMCQGCHGIPGWKTAFPEVYQVPKLGGQHAAYLVKALQAYKSGERSHPSMQGIAAGLSEQDMADLAAYYAGEPAK